MDDQVRKPDILMRRLQGRIALLGHNSEVAIPISYLDDQQWGKWLRLRLNVAVDDADSHCTWTQHQLWWQPDWRSAENLPGSGTFERRWRAVS